MRRYLDEFCLDRFEGLLDELTSARDTGLSLDREDSPDLVSLVADHQQRFERTLLEWVEDNSVTGATSAALDHLGLPDSAVDLYRE